MLIIEYFTNKVQFSPIVKFSRGLPEVAGVGGGTCSA